MSAGLGFFAGANLRVRAGQDGEGRRRDKCGRGVEAGGFEDGFELAGAYDGVDFGDAFLDFVAIALDKATGDDELFARP